MSTLYRSLDNSPGGQIIKLIQRHGALGIKDLRQVLGLSDTAVRQQLNHLMAEGFVTLAAAERAGVGRPQQLYQLTERARDLFACYCEDLALNLYEELLADQGADVVRVLLSRVGDRLAASYQAQVKGQALTERVRSFSQALDQKGILADIDQVDDVIMLHAYTCPYHEIAVAHRQVCEMEQDMMAQVLRADVKLTNCMMDGYKGCSFTVRPLLIAATA